MPVTITVSEVRRELYQVAGFQDAAGDGSPSTCQLGKWFHEGLSYLIEGDESGSPLREMADIDEDLDVWKKTLKSAAYLKFVGPKLTRSQASLQTIGGQVQNFWRAIQAACDWLAELSWELRPTKLSQRVRKQLPYESLADLISTEEPVSCTFREPGWTDSVVLTGVTDAIVRLKQSGAWCAVEFKLGQTSPIADFGQACLYHMLISATELGAGEGSKSLALVSFTPERREQLFDSAKLIKVRSSIIDLIGVLAGVMQPQQKPSSEEPGPAKAPPIVTQPDFTAPPTAEHLEVGQKLVSAYREYSVKISLEEPVIAGPTFLRFPIKLGPKIKKSAVEKFVPEVQVRLALAAPPIVSLEQGRLVIDVQRPDRQTIEFQQVHEQLLSKKTPTGSALVPVGVDLSGTLVFADLSKPEHTHLLVVGTTGSGKSEWLRFAAAGLMEANTPETLRLVVIDPKRNAFHALRESPFLLRPMVFPDEHDTVSVLLQLVEEMDRRYQLFNGVDSLDELNRRIEKPIPRIVCICDEYRELIVRDRNERKEIEQLIGRLGAKARAAGIHLILATQEARRETIAGQLDATIPAKIGLKVGKAIESRLLFGENGAERLLGNGDLLFKDIGEPRRLQAPLLSPADRQQIFGRS